MHGKYFICTQKRKKNKKYNNGKTKEIAKYKESKQHKKTDLHCLINGLYHTI
jgi:hypothetical protein